MQAIFRVTLVLCMQGLAKYHSIHSSTDFVNATCAGNEPVTLERLKQLQSQAAHTQIIVPELDGLNSAVTKLAAFQVPGLVHICFTSCKDYCPLFLHLAYFIYCPLRMQAQAETLANPASYG
jgi:hypothetical protein